MKEVAAPDCRAANDTRPSSDFIVETRALTKRYGGVTATDNVDLRIPRGEIYGIIGPNGAGKSTLVGLLGGAVKASSGQIIYDSEDITVLPAPERARREIGRTYQIPRPFLDMTVAENLKVALFSGDPFISASKARDEVDVILTRTGLSDAADIVARNLPLLRRKRLEVARALMLRPKLLLLDEVGAGLIELRSYRADRPDPQYRKRQDVHRDCRACDQDSARMLPPIGRSAHRGQICRGADCVGFSR